MDNLAHETDVVCRVCSICDRRYEGPSVGCCPIDGGALSQISADINIGALLLGRYRILSTVGSGGWGTVYKATLVSLNKLVAIKMLHAHLAGNQEKVRRFEQEARAICQLAHQNIASVLDFGSTATGQPFFVMEYLEGIGLDAELAGAGALDHTRALRISRQICAGLAAAHEKGIVHRDIKPSNVLLIPCPEGELVKVLDFGLAKLTLDDGNALNHLTQTGETLGTPPYMSPEQCTGLPLDCRSDIYSLGCLMYEGLTGRQPFSGLSAYECMTKHVAEMPAPFVSTNTTLRIPSEVENVVFKALEKDPRRRFQTVLHLQAALDQALLQTESPRLPPWFSLPQQMRLLRHSAKTHQKSLVLIAATVVVSCVSVLLYVAHMVHTDPANLSPLERWRHYMESAQSEMNGGQYRQAEKDFSAALKTTESFGTVDYRRLSLQYLALLYNLMGNQAKEYSTDTIVERDAPAKNDQRAAPNTLTEDPRMLNLMLASLTDSKHPLKDLEMRRVGEHINELCLQGGADKFAPQLVRLESILRAQVGTNNETYARTIEHLAFARFLQQDMDGAIALWTQSSAILSKIVASSNPDLINIYGNLGAAHFKSGHPATAEKYMRLALGGDVNSRKPIQYREMRLEDFAEVLEAQRKYKEAYEIWNKLAQEMRDEKNFASLDMISLRSVHAANRAGLIQLADANLLSTKDALEKEYGGRNDGVASCCVALGESAILQHNLNLAEQYAAQTARIRQTISPPFDNDVRRSLYRLGSLYILEHDYKRAILIYKELLSTARRYAIQDLDAGYRLYPLIKLAFLSHKVGDPWASDQYLHEYRELLAGIRGSRHSNDCTSSVNKYFSEMNGAGLSKSELDHLAFLIEHQVSAGVEIVPSTASCDALSRIAAAKGDFERAVDLERSAIKVLPVSPAGPWQAEQVYRRYAEMLRRTNRNTEADNADREAAKYPPMEI